MKNENKDAGQQQGLDLEPANPAGRRSSSGRGQRKGSALSRIEQRTHEILEKQSRKLKGWAEEIREAPNELLRSALFLPETRTAPASTSEMAK